MYLAGCPLQCSFEEKPALHIDCRGRELVIRSGDWFLLSLQLRDCVMTTRGRTVLRVGFVCGAEGIILGDCLKN